MIPLKKKPKTTKRKKIYIKKKAAPTSSPKAPSMINPGIIRKIKGTKKINPMSKVCINKLPKWSKDLKKVPISMG